MALVNQAKREINAKIVFFGAEQAGKATNLKHVFGKLKPEFRGVMKTMSVQDSRMLFFDFTPPGEANVQGFRVRFHVYTISGPVADAAAWKMVLKGVDGVVFVADAAPRRMAANRESLDNLSAYLKGYGQSLSSVPVVFQFNKCDLPDALEMGEMQRLLNPSGLPGFKASSQSGEGVLQTLLGLVKTVLTGLRGRGLEGIATSEQLQRIVNEPPPVSVPHIDESLPKPESFPVYEAAPEVPAPRAAPGMQAPEFEKAGIEAPELEEAEIEAKGTGSVGACPPLQFEEAGIEAPQFEEAEIEAPETEAFEEPLSVEIAGAPQAAGPGLIRLPLVIRSGARSKSVVLSLAVSLEEG